MLDLLDGPIIGEETHRQLLIDPTLVETLAVANTPQEIQDLQMLYQRQQFGHEKHLVWRDGQKLQITEAEVLQTLRKLGTKGKAHSWDNIADCIFSRRALMRVRFEGVSLKLFADGEDTSPQRLNDNRDGDKTAPQENKGKKYQVKNKSRIQDWCTLIELKLAGKLTDLYNYLLREDLPLPAKQNLIRQIYLPKSTETYPRFENCRPISITSPMYKLIDIVLNDRLTAHLNDGHYRLNSSQTGFRRHIGCEVNILRLSETLR